MSELEYPTLDADLDAGTTAEAAEATGTAIAAASTGQLDIQKLDLTTLALAQFGNWRERVGQARAKLDGLALDLSNQSRIDEAKSLRHRLINVPRADARAVAKGLKARLNATKDKVVEELDTIVAEYDKTELLITPQIEKREAEIAEEKRIAAEKEAARVDAHKANLAKLASYVEHARGLPSSRIADGIAKVEAIMIDRDAWEEFADRADEQKAVTLERMRALLANAQAAEAEAARLQAEREEAARVAEANRIEAERLAAERAELERERAEMQAARDRAAAELKAREEAAAREIAETEARIAAAREAEAKAAEEAPATKPAIVDDFGPVEVDTIADRPDIAADTTPDQATPPLDSSGPFLTKRALKAIDLAQYCGAVWDGSAIHFNHADQLADLIDRVKDSNFAIPF